MTKLPLPLILYDSRDARLTGAQTPGHDALVVGRRGGAGRSRPQAQRPPPGRRAAPQQPPTVGAAVPSTAPPVTTSRPSRCCNPRRERTERTVYPRGSLVISGALEKKKKRENGCKERKWKETPEIEQFAARVSNSERRAN